MTVLATVLILYYPHKVPKPPPFRRARRYSFQAQECSPCQGMDGDDESPRLDGLSLQVHALNNEPPQPAQQEVMLDFVNSTRTLLEVRILRGSSLGEVFSF